MNEKWFCTACWCDDEGDCTNPECSNYVTPSATQTWSAFHLPSGKDHPGFETEEAAWEYVKEHGVCNGCKEQLAAGKWVISYGPNDEEQDSLEISHIANTACGCEWAVGLTDEFDAAESIDDIFVAAGYVEIYNTNNPKGSENERSD